MKRLILMLALAAMTPTAHADEEAAEKINARCADKWADNFRMQKYCRSNETEALIAIGKYVTEHSLTFTEPYETRELILGGCLDKWTDKHGPQWRMVKYCNDNQVEAWESLR